MSKEQSKLLLELAKDLGSQPKKSKEVEMV